jgi:hypothetical protein
LNHFKVISTKPVSPKEESTSLLVSILSLVKGNGKKQNATLSSEQLALVDKSIQRLDHAADTIAHMWDLPAINEENPVFRRTNSNLIDLLQDDLEEADGVQEPQRAGDVGNVLTLRGRHQVQWAR